MHLKLELKEPCEFFWLRHITGVNIAQCCAKCFTGPYDEPVSRMSRGGERLIECDVDESIDRKPVLAYYLCGLSKRYVWAKNTHVAFVPCPGSTVEVDNDQIHLTVTDAREIRFQDYVPSPAGHFTMKQRTCRNWIFANYVRDGMLAADLEQNAPAAEAS